MHSISLSYWVNGLSVWAILCGKRCFITVAPELQALLLVGEAHAVVAVGQPVLAGGAVQQVHVGRAVWRGPGAVLWQVACSRWSPAHGTCLLQLAEAGNKQQEGEGGESARHRNLRGRMHSRPFLTDGYRLKTFIVSLGSVFPGYTLINLHWLNYHKLMTLQQVWWHWAYV